VITSSLIPQKPGERIKTIVGILLDRAYFYYVPTPEDEALRDLVRCREDAKEDELRIKHRLSKFLLRINIKPPSDV
jgi:transposase